MVEERQDLDLFNAQGFDALVNPVNCKGVMGKGIALEFKKRFPESYKVYRDVCERGELKPGMVLFVPGQKGEPNVLHFPTKNHWRSPSRLEWIEIGLGYLKRNYQEWGLKNIVMPQIGCGLGGLDWQDVGALVQAAFADEPLQVVVSTGTTPRFEPRDGQTVASTEEPVEKLAKTKRKRSKKSKKSAQAEQLSLFPEEK